MVLFSYCAKAEKRNYFALSTKPELAITSKGFSYWKMAIKHFKYRKRLLVTMKQECNKNLTRCYYDN